MSRVVDPPGTKGGLRAGNFPGPPKNTFCPEWSHHPGQKPPPELRCPTARCRPRAPLSPFELLPANAVVRHRRPQTTSTVPSLSAPSSSSSPSRRRAPPRRRPPPRPPPPAGLPGPRLGRRLCTSGSPLCRLCALSLYVRRAPPWPCWQLGRALPAGAAPLTLMSIF